jgi:hypothetical protein
MRPRVMPALEIIGAALNATVSVAPASYGEAI